MKSPVKPNGDIIRQFEIRALEAAGVVRTNLMYGLCRRIAAGARVERGALDIQIMDLAGGDRLELDISGSLEECRSENSDCCNWIGVGTRKEIADSDRDMRKHQPTWT